MKRTNSIAGDKSKRTVTDETPLFLSFFNRSSIRISLLLIPTFILALVFTIALNPIFVPIFADPLARQITKELDPQAIGNFEMLRLIRKYNLAWCYLTDGDNVPLPSTAAFVPRTRRIPQQSGQISIRDESYFEAVVPYTESVKLHIGLPFGIAVSLPDVTKWDSIISFFRTPVQLGVVLLVFLVVWFVIFLLIESVVGLSIRILGGTIDKLTALVSEQYTVQQVEEIAQLNWASGDFRALGRGLTILMDRVTQIKDEGKEKGLDALKWKSQKRQFQPTETRSQSADLRKVAEASSIESGVFAVKFDKQLRVVESSYEFAVILLDGIHELYSDTLDAAAFIKVEKNHSVTIESVLGLDDESLELLNRIDHREFVDERNMSKKSVDVGPMLIKKMGFDTLAAKDQIGRIVYLPFYFEGKPLALLAGFMRVGNTPTPERMRALERFRDKALELYYEHRQREDKEDDRWTDPATGMGNKTYFQELMPKVVERSKFKTDGKFSVLMLAPDFNTPRLARFPQEMQDRWFTDIGRLIGDLLPISKRLAPEKGATNYLIRYQEHVMAVVLEGINGSAAVNVAEGIRNSILSKVNWSGGATDLSVSIGVATYPRDGDTAEDIINRAGMTLSYVRENLGGNAVCDAQKLPEAYKPKSSTEIHGKLGVLDVVGLLQSIATTEKSGILIVENDIGQKFVSTWVNGKPFQANVGELSGINAMVEFVTTFKNGEYNFQTSTSGEADANIPQELSSLERCLMESALLEDKMVAALKAIPSADRLVRGINNPPGWDQVALDDEVTPEEIEAMKVTYSMADGSKTLSTIFSKLSTLSTAMKWRAAALLLQYQLMEMKTN